jgi:hypothetical protein
VKNLEKLFKGFARRRHARWWVGARPDDRESRLGRIIATKVAYPTSADDPFADNGMVRLNRGQAAHVLSVAGTIILAHERPVPKTSRVNSTLEALGDLADGATFLSNGLWEAGASLSWNPLTSASFDCGVIGYDATNAFIF